LVLAAAAGQARRLRLKPTSLARGTYPQAAKPLSTANGVGRSPLLEQDTHARKRLLPFSHLHHIHPAAESHPEKPLICLSTFP